MRVRAVIVGAVLVLAGCGADGSPTVDTPSSSTSSSSAAGGGARPTVTTGVRGVATTESPPRPAPAPAGVGSLARWVLGRSGARTVTLDVLEQATATPRAAALDHVVEVLRSSSDKPVSVRHATLPSGSRSWSHDDLVAAADASGARAGDGEAVLHLLFVNGHSADNRSDERVLGVSVRGDVAAVFVDDVDGAGSPLVSPARIEAAVATHELGHLLGLVDLVIDSGRDDPGHPGHSTNPGSVMYWAVESDLVADLLTGGPPDDFDDADRADLARLRDL